MKLDLAKVSFEGQWFPFGEGRVKIRPCPKSRNNIKVVDGGFEINGADNLKNFCYCFMDWEGFEDPNGKPIKLTEEAKTKVFDGDLMGLPKFVQEKRGEMERAMAQEEKN